MEEALKAVLDNAGAKILHNDYTAAPVVAVPEGYKLESLEPFLAEPVGVRQHVELHELDDFVAYVNRYKRDQSIVFIQPAVSGLGGKLARCVLDYHRKGDGRMGLTLASRCEHTATFIAKRSAEYEMLVQLDSAIVEQDAFARAVELLAHTITGIPGAEVLEILRTIRLTSSGRFQSYTDDFSGSVDFAYELEVKASAGTVSRKLSVPREVTFFIPVLAGGKEQAIKARLVYRIPAEAGGKVKLGFNIPDRRWIEEAVVTDVASSIRSATELLTVVGSANSK